MSNTSFEKLIVACFSPIGSLEVGSGVDLLNLVMPLSWVIAKILTDRSVHIAALLLSICSVSQSLINLFFCFSHRFPNPTEI
jgi:hypothetical protein